MKSKKIIGAMLIILVPIIIILCMFQYVKPALLKSKVPEISRYLVHEGYKNPKFVSASGWYDSVTLTTDSNKMVEVYVNGNNFQIKY